MEIFWKPFIFLLKHTAYVIAAGLAFVVALVVYGYVSGDGKWKAND